MKIASLHSTLSLSAIDVDFKLDTAIGFDVCSYIVVGIFVDFVSDDNEQMTW